jgi:YVTN family beta-propeller protein
MQKLLFLPVSSDNRCTMVKTFAVISALVLLCAAGCSRPNSEKTEPGFRIYITNESSGDMSIIDGTTHEVLRTVPLGKRPRGIHASPDGKTIYVALSGSPIGGPGVDESKLPPPDKSADGIGVFDIAQNKVTRMIESGSDPENFDLSIDGRLIFVSNEDDSKASIVDVATSKVTKSFSMGGEPEGVKTTPDGKFVYITSEDTGTISVLDVAQQKMVKTFKVGRRPRNVEFLPDGSRAYVNAENDGSVLVVDTTKFEVVKTITLGERGVIKPMGLALSNDGKTLYVSSGRGHKVFEIDTASDTIRTSFEVGERPWGLGLSPDGKYLYTANGPTNDVSVVELSTKQVVKKVKVGRGSWGVLVVK